MSAVTIPVFCCDHYLIISEKRNFGHIIESNTQREAKNIFDIYDMPLSELEYIKREILSGKDVFAALTSSGRALVLVKLKRSSYIMGVICVTLERLRYITNYFAKIHTSPTLTRRLRKCDSDIDENGVCELLALYFEQDNQCNIGKELIYKSILEYSSVYNIDVEMSSIKNADQGLMGVTHCEDMLHLFLHFMFITAARCGSDRIHIILSEIADRVIIHSEMNCNSFDIDTKRLDDISSMADALSVSFKYKLDGVILQMALCPYYIDDSQHGLKSKILFDF